MTQPSNFWKRFSIIMKISSIIIILVVLLVKITPFIRNYCYKREIGACNFSIKQGFHNPLVKSSFEPFIYPPGSGCVGRNYLMYVRAYDNANKEMEFSICCDDSGTDCHIK